MSITYTYTVIHSDLAAKSMVVEYEAEGYETFQIGAPLPVIGQTVEDVVKAYAPIPQWVQSKLDVQDVPVGASGSITPTPSADTVPANISSFVEVPLTEITGGSA